MAVVAEACRTVSELHIPEEASVEAKIRKLAVGVCKAKTKLAKVQFELNLKITELQLKAQPSTPLKFREKREAAVKDAFATVDVSVTDCIALFEQSLEILTSLQEDPNLQSLATEARELQQWYNEVRVTARTVAITQRLAKLQEAKGLKEQVDIAQ